MRPVKHPGSPTTPTTRDISRANRLTILRYLYAGKAASRPELSRGSGLSPATVANLVTDLIDAGIVAETGVRISAGGRPRAELAVNAGRGVLVGVDVRSEERRVGKECRSRGTRYRYKKKKR